MIVLDAFSAAVEQCVEGWDRIRSWYSEDRFEYVMELRVSEVTLLQHMRDIPPRIVPTVGDIAKQLVKLRARKGMRRYGRKHGNR